MIDLHPVNHDNLGDMPIEEFRKQSHKVVDWICSYLDNIDSVPVLPSLKPGDIKNRFIDNAPEDNTSFEEIMQAFEQNVFPGVTHWNSPNFHAYFSISSSAPAMLGEMLSNALNVNGMLWKTSPSATEVEEVVAKWLRDMMRLPEDFFGMIVDTASIASLYALAAAREKLTDLDIRTKGYPTGENAQSLTIYCSEHAHSSIDKAAITLGFGLDNVRRIKSDELFRMDPDELEKAILTDIESCKRPVAVVATIGTTSTTSIDPVEAIGLLCQKYDLWLHVDAAYGGMAAMLPEFEHLSDGLEYVDSYVTNPHKWLFVPVDLSMFYFKDKELFKKAFSVIPEYLVTKESESATDFMNYGVQLGRRFRSLKLWFVLSYFGTKGIENRIRYILKLTQHLCAQINEAENFKITAPTPFSTICFRYDPGGLDEPRLQELNARLMETVNATGKLFISHTKLQEKYTLRFAIGNLRTTEKHINRAWSAIVECAENL